MRNNRSAITYNETFASETTMDRTTLYRTTPYEFALTAEPRQITVTYGRTVSGTPPAPTSADIVQDQEAGFDSGLSV
jgi:hypothetical protein